jgi:hypothetical protein
VRAVGHLSIAPRGFLGFSLSSDKASDKCRLQKPLILEVKLMSALGAEGTNQRSKNETFFLALIGSQSSGPPIEALPTGVSVI